MQRQLSCQHWTVPTGSTSVVVSSQEACSLLVITLTTELFSLDLFPSGNIRTENPSQVATAPPERLTPWLWGSGQCWAQLPAKPSRAEGSRADTSPAPPTGAGERPWSVSIRRRRVPASGTLEQGTAPGVAPPPPDSPGFPLPSSPARSSSKERKGAAPERCRRRPGEQGGHGGRHHLLRGRPAPGASATAPRPAPLCWKRSGGMSFASEPPVPKESACPTGLPSSPCAVLIIVCPEREHLVMGWSARGNTANQALWA